MINEPALRLDWEAVEIPESAPPVALARLRREDGGGRWLMVRFPPGWERPGSGHYEVEEEFWVLEGELEISGVRYAAGQGGRLPAGTERWASASPAGALTVARFAGPPCWVGAGDRTT